MSSLWLTLEPQSQEVLLSLSRACGGLTLRGRFPLPPHQAHALPMLLEAIVDWFGLPLSAVLDADAADVRRRPEFWARFLGEIDRPRVSVEWVSLPPRSHARDRFLGKLGRSTRSDQLAAFAAAGKR